MKEIWIFFTAMHGKETKWEKNQTEKKKLLLTGVGCPSKSESILRRLARSETGNKPASAQAAYNMGAAWPWKVQQEKTINLANDKTQ